MIKEKIQKIIIISIPMALFLIPFFWSDQNTFNIGGDDTHLYFLVPSDWMENFVLSSWWSLSIFPSYNPQYFFIPFTLMIFLLKHVFFFLNTQKLILGITLSLSFLSSYLFFKEITSNNKSNNLFYASVIAGLSYSFLPILYYIEWPNLLYDLYGIFVYPLILLFFMKSIKKNKKTYLIYGSLLSAIFAPSIFAIPWSFAFLIGASIFLFFYFVLIEYNKTIFVKYSTIYLLIFIMINAFWLVPFFTSIFLHNPATSYVLSNSGIKDAVRLVNALAPSMNIFDTLSGLLSRGLIYNFGWSEIKIAHYTYSLVFLSILLPLVIFSGFLAKTKNSLNERKMLTIFGITTLILAFFQTVNIGQSGIDLFNFMMKNIPGWVVFRNFYGKFPIAYSFFYSITLGLSVYLILENISKKVIRNILIVGILLVIILQAVPFIRGDVNNLSYYPEMSLSKNVEIPQEYISTMKYISELDTDSKLLTLPLTIAQYSIFKSADNKGIYVGVSPVKIFTGKDDFSGKMSFDNNYIPKLPDEINNALKNNNYTFLRNIFGLLNIHYVLYNSDIPESVNKRYMWNYDKFNDKKNMEQLISNITDKKMVSYGSFSIYKTKTEYVIPHIFVPLKQTVVSSEEDFFDKIKSENFKIQEESIFINSQNNIQIPIIQSKVHPKVFFQKINPINYKIKIENASEPFYLVFSEPYHPSWKAYINTDQVKFTPIVTYSNLNIAECKHEHKFFETKELKRIFSKSIPEKDHFVVNGYANAWYINPQELGTGENFTITLYFKPQSYFYVGIVISVLTFIACMGYLLYSWKRKMMNKITGRAEGKRELQ